MPVLNNAITMLSRENCSVFKVLLYYHCFLTIHFSRTGPLGMCTFMISMVVNLEDPAAQILALAYFALTVILGLVLHFFITMPIIYFILVRNNPFKYMIGCFQALSTAFLTGNRYVKDSRS